MPNSSEDLIYWITIVSFLIPIILAIILTSFVISYQKKKYQYETDKKDALLREQALIIEKQTALQAERTRIAGEMHDDLGGGLTTIKFLSEKVMRELDNEEQRDRLNKIVVHSQSLVNNMSEIIWAMNAGFDTLDNLIAYSRRYAREYLEVHHINLRFRIEGDPSGIEMTGEKRRNILLVIKEVLHNAVKHSGASNFDFIFTIDTHIRIELKDDGNGIPDAVRLNGNGLKNIKKRINSLDGELDLSSADLGTTVLIKLKIENL